MNIVAYTDGSASKSRSGYGFVVLADDEEGTLVPKEIKSTTTKFVDGTFSNQTPGTVFQNALYNSKHKTGVWNVHSSEDGNVYLQSQYEEGNAGAVDNADFYFSTGSVVNYDNNLADYPYVAFDFDVMTENGTYGNYPSLSFCVYKNGARLVELASTKFNQLKLDATPYRWQHVTYIVASKGNGYFHHYFFVNGVLTYDKPTDQSGTDAFKALEGDFSNITLGYYRMYPEDKLATDAHIGYDNFRFTLYPAGYCEVKDGVTDFSNIVNHIYNDSYKLPYGRTEAKVGDKVYDDVTEAVEAAEAGQTVTLTVNAPAPLTIDKGIYLDTNIYGEDGNPTGTYYTYSYKTSSELVPVETKEGSGIYKFEHPDDIVALITDANGVVVGNSTAADLPAKINALPGNRTVTLINDAIMAEMINLPNKNNITIDLNGYTLSKQVINVIKYNATIGENGEYVKGDKIITETISSSGGYVFYFGALSSTYSFTLKSSRPGAAVGGATVNVEQLVYNGEAVKNESATITGGVTLFNFYPVSGTVNILGENVTFYITTLIYAEHGSNGKEKVNIDGGTFVNLGSASEGILALRNGEKATVKNATFYCGGVELIRNTSGTGNRNLSTEITFENCKIYGAGLYDNANTDKHTFNNCILDLSVNNSTTATIVIGKNTVLTSDLVSSRSNVILADGLVGEKLSKTLYYNKVTKAQVVFDLDTITPTDKFTNNYSSLSFVYLATTADAETAKVTWLDADGNFIKETEEFVGTYAFAPKTPWGDGYRGVLNASWVDENGKAVDLLISEAGEYEFTAILPAKEDAVFVAYVTDAMFNMTYYAHFGYNFYAPVVEGVTVVKIGSATTFGTKLIYGAEYYVANVGYPDSTSAADNSRIWLVFQADGVEYSVEFYISAMLYANLAIVDPMANEYDKEAVGCLVRYIEESYKAKGTLTDATAAKFASFYEIYTPADYVTQYPAAAVHTLDEKKIEEHVESVQFGLCGARVSFIVTLTDEAVAKGYRVYLTGISYGEAYKDSAKKVWYTNNTPLASYVMTNTIGVEIRDGDGKTVVTSFNYSLATYIVEMEKDKVNVDLAKSLYALGDAIKKVRANIY